MINLTTGTRIDGKRRARPEIRWDGSFSTQMVSAAPSAAQSGSRCLKERQVGAYSVLRLGLPACRARPLGPFKHRLLSRAIRFSDMPCLDTVNA